MAFYTVDFDKCKQDGICVSECPARIIKMDKKSGFPFLARDYEQFCINCGHCVAVCPHGAISLKTMGPRDCPPVQKNLLPDFEHAAHFLASRRSIRTYKKQPVERDVVLKLIDIASMAPTGSNKQPVHWLVIEDSSQVSRLAELVIDWMRLMLEEYPQEALSRRMDRIVASHVKGEDRICRGAPHIIVAHYSKDVPRAETDCVIALTYWELAAFATGLGVCWAGYLNAAAAVYPPVQKALGLPKGHRSAGALLYGYPKYQYHRIPLRNKPVISWR